jgi:hypothetical protein
MLHFIDQTSEGDHHMVFNAALISILLKMYPEDKLTAHGIPSNQRSIKELLQSDELKRVIFNEIIYTKPTKESTFYIALNYLKKERIRKFNFRDILKNSEERDLLFLSTTSFTCFYYFKKQKKNYKVPTLAALHGDIILSHNVKGVIGKLNVYFNKQVLKLKIRDFKYLLLNKIAKPFLVKSGLIESDELLEINHPFLFINQSIEERDIYQSKPIRIGHIGSMEVERKGSQHIYSVAEALKNEIEQQQIQFKVVGLQTPELMPYKNKWVEESVGNNEPDKPQYLSRTQYEEELKLLDYCIFFYPSHQYVYRASGAVVDFINGLIPIITLKHPFFDYLFEVGGNIGFVCNDLKEIELLLKKIANADSEILDQYKQQQKNIQLLQEQFSVDTIAKDLKHQMALYF